MSTRARVLLGAIAVVLIAAPAAGGALATPHWTTYHGNYLRTGFDPTSSTPVTPHRAWRRPTLDGDVYGQPLVYGSSVFVATENNTVYALSASTGKVIWRRHAGMPVPSSALPCGDIGPNVGITGTPVIDPATNAIYAVADVFANGRAHHMLIAYNVSTGRSVIAPREVDVGGINNPQFVPENELQRAGLALDGHNIVIGFGGNDGDCGHYHGWLVASSDTGTGALLHYQVGTHSDKGAAIWGGGGGPVVDSAGDIYATTGNGFSTTTYDRGNSIIKLDSNLHELDHYAPSTWAADNRADADLGSENAVLLPGGYLFQSGKNGTGYLVNSVTGKMGGTGVAGHPDPSAFHAPICGPGGWGGPAYHGGWIYAPCGEPGGGGGGGLVAMTYNPTKPSFTVRWTGPSDATSPPIVAANLVWLVSVSSNTLYGLNRTTGNVVFRASLPRMVHFTSPSAGGGRLFVATGQTVNAFVIASTTG